MSHHHLSVIFCHTKDGLFDDRISTKNHIIRSDYWVLVYLIMSQNTRMMRSSLGYVQFTLFLLISDLIRSDQIRLEKISSDQISSDQIMLILKNHYIFHYILVKIIIIEY